MHENSISIQIDKLKEKAPIKTMLVNFRVEDSLYKSFQELCENELNQPMSEVLRKMMREVCSQKLNSSDRDK